MRNEDDTVLEPYGLLDAISAGFEDGLHPDLHRLMHECKASALLLKASNIVAFPSRFQVSGNAMTLQNHDFATNSDGADIIDIGNPLILKRLSKKAACK